MTTSRLGIWAGGEQRPSRGCDLHREHQTSHSGGVFNRGMRLCWNGKYGGSGPTSSLEHGAWRKANSDSTGRARRRYDRPRCVSRLESMTWGRTRRGPRSIYADDSGSEEERAAGGAGQGAADPERARSAHSSGWRRYMDTCNGHRGSPQAES